MLTEDTNLIPLNNLDLSEANGQHTGNLIATEFSPSFPDNFPSSGSFSTPTLEEVAEFVTTDGRETEIPGNFAASVSRYNFSPADSEWNYSAPLTGDLTMGSDSTDSLMRGFLTDNQAVLEIAVSQAQETLAAFTNDEEFFGELNQAFNTNVTSEEAKALIEELARGKTLPKMEIVSPVELNHANAAFGEGTIYLSEEFLSKNVNNPEVVTEILLEEMGHFVDRQLSSGDSEGDEGDIFARLVQGETISEAELNLLQQENDRTTITLNGEKINVELSESRTPYTIESGDTLSQIAQNELGDGTLWTTIEKEDGTTFSEAEAQQIQPGQVVYLPGSSEPVRTPYTIESGDTLSQIAQEQLGDGTLWTTIEKEDGTTFSEAEAQQIQPGQVVYLPGESSGGDEPEPSPPDELTGNFKEDIVTIANREWEFFDGGNLQETEEGAWQRVVEYWETPGIDNFLGVDSPQEVGSSNNPWSAAFVSWVMNEGGAGDRFEYSASHSTYITDSIEDRENNDSETAFFGYRLDEYSPQVGDLVGYARQDGVGYDTPAPYQSHTDIVVDVRDGEIDVIGGNVANSVTKKTLAIDSEGRLIDQTEDWFVVMSNQIEESTSSSSYDVNEIIASSAVEPEIEQYAADSIPLILEEAEVSEVTDPGQIAYILATADHENGLGKYPEELGDDSYFERYEPETEIGQQLGNTEDGDGARFKGRGFVQITGRSNYQEWSERLGIDLISNPELASEFDVASEILVQGMRDGTFTGVGLSDYINGENRDFYNARRVVNGVDRAEEIAEDAERYYEVLTA